MINDIIKEIDHMALNNPDRNCYIDSDGNHTYGDLKTQSDHLAGYFKEVLPEKEPIMVFGGQTFQMIETFLGLSKSGHAYIPIDVNSSEDRIKQIKDISNSPAIIAVEKLPIHINDVIIIDNDDLLNVENNNIFNYDSSNSVKNDEIYYIIFTSGTTGLPKGVQISHSNLLSFVNWDIESFNLYKNIKAISQAPYSFDLSVMDLYPTLCLGGTLLALPKNITDDFKKLFSILPTLNINEWVSTPSFVEMCLLDKNFNQSNYSNLNRFLFCGEELVNKTARMLLERFPDAQIYNTYGPTEATVAVTGIQITNDIIRKYPRLPIGYPKPDTDVFISNDGLHKVNDCKKGEIIIAGPSVSKGYLNNPIKTHKSFFEYDGKRAYHTGDIGFSKDNMFFYCGRSDFQVKMHGYRIELEDIDNNLSQISYIKQAATVPKYDNNSRVTQLISFIVLKNNKINSQFEMTQKIKKDLKELVMPYMVPQRFIYKESLPLSSNGKIDRKSLISEVNNK